MSENGYDIFEILIACILIPILAISFYMTLRDLQLAIFYLVGGLVVINIYLLYVLGKVKNRLYNTTQKTETEKNQEEKSKEKGEEKK